MSFKPVLGPIFWGFLLCKQHFTKSMNLQMDGFHKRAGWKMMPNKGDQREKICKKCKRAGSLIR